VSTRNNDLALTFVMPQYLVFPVDRFTAKYEHSIRPFVCEFVRRTL